MSQLDEFVAIRELRVDQIAVEPKRVQAIYTVSIPIRLIPSVPQRNFQI